MIGQRSKCTARCACNKRIHITTKQTIKTTREIYVDHRHQLLSEKKYYNYDNTKFGIRATNFISKRLRNYFITVLY